MSKCFITVTGLRHYFGADFVEPKMTVRLIKEPDNDYDREAIRVEMEGLGKIGYVANSPHTVQGESFSAGRIYDRIPDAAEATVMYVLPNGLLCSLEGLAPILNADGEITDHP